MKIKINHLTTFPLVSDWLMFRGQGWILLVQGLGILCCTWVWAGKAVFSIHPQPKRWAEWADLASPPPCSPVKPLDSVWPGVPVPCHWLHSQTKALVSGRLWAGVVIVDGWGSGTACWLPWWVSSPSSSPLWTCQLRSFRVCFTERIGIYPEPLKWLDSWGACRSGRSKSLLDYGPERGGAMVGEQGYKKPELIYWMERMANLLRLLCQALVKGQWTILAHSIFVTTLWSQYYSYPHLQKRKCST